MTISNVPYTVNIVYKYTTHEMIIGLRHLICVSLKCSRPAEQWRNDKLCTVVCFVMAFSSYTDMYVYIYYYIRRENYFGEMIA